jgi:phage terminase small subunit
MEHDDVQQPDRGKRYSPELWALIRSLWEQTEGMSHAKAGKIASEQLHEDCPARSAIVARQSREGWIKGNTAVVAPRVKREPKPAPVKKRELKPIPAPKPVFPDDDEPELIDVDREEAGLSDKEWVFVRQYVTHLNAVRAAKEAGFYRHTSAKALLEKKSIQLAIEGEFEALQKRSGITVEMVLARYWDLATANPNDLVEHRRTCCRYCHGENHMYQWTAGEYERAQLLARQEDQPEPPIAGGLGFDMRKSPNPDCPDCGGDGIGRTIIKDTRNLSGPALVLYAGVEPTKEGERVKMHNQLSALETVAKHIGMLREKLDVNVNISASNAELDAIYERRMEEMRRKALEARGRGPVTLENGE